MLKNVFKERYQRAEHREFYDSFFSRIPDEVLPYLNIKAFLPGEIMIQSVERSQAVYFLMRGKAYAIEDRIQSLPYVFVELHPVGILGDYELFADKDQSYATIAAAEPCECIAMPSSIYLEWISEDSGALFYRIRLLMNQLGEQSAAGRQYFFMDHTARCAVQILQYAVKDGPFYVMKMTRERLAARLGCSLRTCHRVVEDLERQGLICLRKGKITVSSQQRQQLAEYLERETFGL